MVRGRGHHRLGRCADRLLLRPLVELVAPAAVESGDGLVAVLSSAAAQRVRNSLPDDGIHHAEGENRVAADRNRARAASVRFLGRARMTGGYITGGWSFVWAAY